jgi:hypothetical protein
MFKHIIILLIFFIIIIPINCLDLTISTNNNSKIDRWLNADICKDLKKFYYNKNDKPDESFFYTSDKKIIYFINNESFDYKNTGKPTIWIKNELKDNDVYTEIKADQNYTGKIDLVILKKNDVIYYKKTSTKSNDNFDVEENFEIPSGKKIKESVDTNNDGKMDDFYFYENNLLVREELSTKFDGKIDMWVLFNYNPDNTLKDCVIQKDNNGDGKPDEWHYTDSKRRVIKVEKSTKFDGKIDYIKKYN